jgi:hypothetical protein
MCKISSFIYAPYRIIVYCTLLSALFVFDNTVMPPYPLIQYVRFTMAQKKILNERNKQFISFKTCAKRQRAVTWLNPAAQTCPVLDSSSLSLYPRFPVELASFLLLVFSLFTLVAALLQCLCSEILIYQLNCTIFMFVTQISCFI